MSRTSRPSSRRCAPPASRRRCWARTASIRRRRSRWARWPKASSSAMPALPSKVRRSPSSTLTTRRRRARSRRRSMSRRAMTSIKILDAAVAAIGGKLDGKSLRDAVDGLDNVAGVDRHHDLQGHEPRAARTVALNRVTGGAKTLVELVNPARRRRAAGAVETLLDVHDLRVSYGPIQAVRGVSLSVAKGEIVALLGANGAGKSSILKAVMGIAPRSTGRISFDGDRDRAHRYREHRPARADARAGRPPRLRPADRSRESEDRRGGQSRRCKTARSRTASACTRFSASLANGAASSPARFRAASSRCWRSRAPSCPSRACCCSTSLRSALRPTSSIRSSTS